MRVAYLSGAYIPSRDANSVHVMRMCQAMAKIGHQVTLYSHPGDATAEGDFEFYGVDQCFGIVKIPRPRVRILGAVQSAWHMRYKVLEGNPHDLVYAREYWALFLLSRSGVPFVFESHWQPKSLLHKTAEALFMRRQDFRRAVLISDELRNIYTTQFPWLPKTKLLVAHDGADPVPLVASSRPTLGRERVLQVGYVGSFWPGYGVDLIKDLAIAIPESDFHVVGGGPEQVAERKRRDAEVNNLYYHGFIRPPELPGYYAALDLMLAPYQKSTPHIRWISPMKLFEYMAYGKAIVCSDFPVMREILNNGENGLLVPSDDNGAWVSAIRELACPSRRRALGQAARERLEREFTWEARARRVLDGVV